MMPFVQFSQPIEALIPPFKDPFERQHFIDTELARLTPIVSVFLREVGLSTTFSRTNINSHGAPSSPKQRSFDIITAYLHTPLGSLDSQRMVEPLMILLEEGIGTYLARQERARRELIYPTVWLAYIVRLPITVLIRAGILPSTEFISNIYGKLIQVLALIFIVLLSIKLGVTIPWAKIIGYFLK